MIPLLTTIAVAFALFWLTLWKLFTARSSAYCVLEPCQNKVFHLADVSLPGIEPVVRFRTNSHGIRGPEFSSFDDHRILALGCSVAISQYVDQSRTWTHLLQRQLCSSTGCRVWIGVAAKSEFTSGDVVTLTHYFLPQYQGDIDTVLIWVGVNDLALVLSKREDYDPGYAARAGQEHQMHRAFVRMPEGCSPTPGGLVVTMRRLLSCLKHSLIADHFVGEGAFYAHKRSARKGAVRMLDTLPRSIELGLDEYENNINQIVNNLKAYKVRPVFLTIPSLWEQAARADVEDLLWFGWIGATGEYYAASVLAQGIDLYNQRLLKVCHDREVECADLAAILPKSTDVFYDDVHLNLHGNSLAADALHWHFSQSTLVRRALHFREAL